MKNIGIVLAIIAIIFIFSGIACGSCYTRTHVYVHGRPYYPRTRWFIFWHRPWFHHHHHIWHHHHHVGFRRGFGFRGGGSSWGK